MVVRQQRPSVWCQSTFDHSIVLTKSAASFIDVDRVGIGRIRSGLIERIHNMLILVGAGILKIFYFTTNGFHKIRQCFWCQNVPENVMSALRIVVEMGERKVRTQDGQNRRRGFRLQFIRTGQAAQPQ